MESTLNNNSLDEWRKEFQGWELENQLPFFLNERNNSEITLLKSYNLNDELVKSINRLTSGSDQLNYIVIISAICQLIKMCTGNKKINFGIQINNNGKNQLSPLIVNLNEINNFQKLLIKIRRQFIELESHGTLDVKLLSEDCIVKEVIGEMKRFAISMTDMDAENFLIINSNSSSIKLTWKTNLSEIELDKIQEMLVTIIYQGVLNFTSNFSEYEFVTEEQKRKKLISSYYGGVYKHNTSKHIVSYIFEMCEKLQDKVAIKTENMSMKYGELAIAVERLSQILKNNGVDEGKRVAIIADRSIETIISILAILKLGASYVPIEMDYPLERVKFIVNDSKSILLLVPKGEEVNYQLNVKTLNVTYEMYSDHSVERYKGMPHNDLACYVIYTSGTTGKPKGVEIKNKGILNLCNWFIRVTNLKETSNLILLNPFGFDASVKNIFSPFLVGSTLVMGPDILFDVERVLKIVRNNNITHLNCVPRLFYELLECDKENSFESLKNVKQVVLGGEALESRPLLPWAQSQLELKILNVYGPTESTSVSTSYSPSKQMVLNLERIPIGKPIDNKYVYILNSERKLCPEYLAGELYISGIGTVDHYISEHAKNKLVFYPNPFLKGQIMYKTGDIGKLDSFGNILYLGRKDGQVKINGHRVELAEIESRLNEYNNVMESIVLFNNEYIEKQNLYAFVIKKSNSNLSEVELKSYLERFFPQYMIPSKILVLDEFPMTINGKTDKKKLISYIDNRTNGIGQIDREKSELKRTLHKIWLDVLNIEHVGYDENFFDVGGYSLLLYKVTRKVNSLFNTDLSFIDMMTYSTINSLAKHIEETKNNLEEKIEFESNAKKRLNRIRRKRIEFEE